MMSNSCIRAGNSASGIARPLKRSASRVPRSAVHQLARLLSGEVGRAQLDHLARADEQHALVCHLVEDTLRKTHRGGGHRNRLRADLRSSAHFLRHREGALKQLVQISAERAGFGRGTHRILHLSDDLRLAEHH